MRYEIDMNEIEELRFLVNRRIADFREAQFRGGHLNAGQADEQKICEALKKKLDRQGEA